MRTPSTEVDLRHTSTITAQRRYLCMQLVMGCSRSRQSTTRSRCDCVPTMLASLCGAHRAGRPPGFPKLASFRQPSSSHSGWVRFTCEGETLWHVPCPRADFTWHTKHKWRNAHLLECLHCTDGSLLTICSSLCARHSTAGLPGYP